MAKEKRDVSQVEFAENPPKWVKESDIDLIKGNDDIKSVIEFFVVNSPCANVSARGVDLTQYLWNEKNPPKNKYLYNSLLSAADLIENESLFIGEGADKTQVLFKTSGMGKDFYERYTTNRIALLSGGNLIIDIFRVIRNCFAHCRFTIISLEDDYIIAMENGTAAGKHFEVKARLLLKLSVLIEWIRIIKEDYYKENEYNKKIESEIDGTLLDVIREYGDYKTDEIIEKVPYPKSDVIKAKKRLVGKGLIHYSRKEKRWMVFLEETNGKTN